MMKLKNTILSILLSGVAWGGAFSFAALAPAVAHAQEDDGEAPRRRSETLDPAVAKVLQEVFELISAEDYRGALAKLNQLVSSRGDGMKAFDKSTTYEMRASVKYNLEDFRGALSDFQTALNANGFPVERNNQIRYYIAQLNLQLENYAEAIRGLNEWISLARAAGQPIDANAYYLLAAAYVQSTPPNYRAAMQPAEQAVAARTEPKKGDYDLLNLVYSELNESTKRGGILEKMVNLWPGERSYWTQLSALYNTSGRDQDAFSVLEVAYRAGLLKNENEILTLVQYYSFFDNPYRGAKLLAREMETGVVKENVKNLTLLSQLWSQSREHKRAIPVLQKAATMSDTGELSYRLGQVLVADEQYAAADRALVAAINKGGMTSNQTGDCWLLIGTARFAQAGPGDRATRARSREAFVRAQGYANTRTQASQWVKYIDAINQTEKDQDALEKAQQIEARQAQIARERQGLNVCRLQARPEAECAAIEQNIRKLEAEQAAAQGGADTPPAGAPSEPSGESDASEEAAEEAPTDAPAEPQ
ncbi:MAG: hypothetical protein RIA10_10535 [Amphiplicatus sp.]